MAAPLIAGQALLIVAAIPKISVDSTRKIIEQSATRGTLLGSQIDPDAPGSRVAMVPWLNVHPSRVASISQGNASLTPAEIRSMYDTVMVHVGTLSSTNPAMQFAVEQIATKLHSSLKESMESTGASSIFVKCSGIETSQHSESRKGSASVRARGWDFRQKNDEAGVHALTIVCNISSDAGTGKVVKEELSNSLQTGALRDFSGNNATLLGKPVLTRAQSATESKGLSVWKLATIAISGSGLVVVGTLVVVFSLRRQRRCRS